MTAINRSEDLSRTHEVRQLASKIADLSRRLSRMERAEQASFTSIADGTLDIVDGDGNLVGSIGMQDDGTFGTVHRDGPTPPAPTPPLVDQGALSLAVTWDGLFIDGSTATADFARVEIHTSPTTGFTPDATTYRGSITTPAGGTKSVPTSPASPMFVVLVAVSTAGAISAPSEERSGVAQATADGKGTVYYEPTAPASGTEFDVWFDTDNDYLPHRWDTATSAWVATPLGTAAIGNLDAGRITTGTLSGILLVGNTIETSATGRRVVLDGTGNQIDLYSGSVSEAAPGAVSADVSSYTRSRYDFATHTFITVTVASQATATLQSPDVGYGSGKLVVGHDSFGGWAKVQDGAGVAVPLTADSFLDANGHPLPAWAGMTPRTWDAGQRTANVDANNRITVGHNIGATPIAATANGTDAVYGLRWRPDLSDNSNLVFTVRDSNGVLVTAGVTVSIAFTAIG